MRSPRTRRAKREDREKSFIRRRPVPVRGNFQKKKKINRKARPGSPRGWNRVNGARELRNAVKAAVRPLRENFRNLSNDGRVPKADFENSHEGKVPFCCRFMR